MPRDSSYTLIKREEYDEPNNNSNEPPAQDQRTASLLMELETCRNAYNKILSKHEKDKTAAQSKHNQLSVHIESLESSISQLNMVNGKLNSDMVVSNTKSRELEIVCDQLKDENAKLRADIAVAKINICKCTQSEFEVENILDDKIEKRRKYYLIKWKGYDDNFNSWEKKSALKCSQLLNKYLKIKSQNA